MSEPARRWVAAGLAAGASGLALGLWLWLLATPDARILLPDEDVAFARGPATRSLPACLVLGVAGVSLAWLGLGLVLARVARTLSGPLLVRSAPAWLPLLLLLADASRLALPLGALTSPLVALTYEGRWPLAAAVALAILCLHGRLLLVSLAIRNLAAQLPRPAVALPPRSRRLACLVFAGVAVGYLAFLPRALLVGPTGDEPDYLLLAHSLLMDRDLDLRNNIEAQDYRHFIPRLQPHVRGSPDGGLYSAHRPGLSLLILPAYAIAWLVGAPVRVAVMVFLCLLAALLVARTVGWSAELAGHRPSALLAGAGLAFTAPGFFYAYAIYPELPVALLVLALLSRIRTPGAARPWVTGGLVASLPWFHEKFWPLAVVGAGLALRSTGWRPRALAGVLGPLAASGLLQALYYLRLYGRPFPVGVHAGFSLVPHGLVGLWLDRDHGLLTLAPVYILALTGAATLARAQPGVLMTSLGLFGSLYAVVGAYQEWWGGFAPAPRYLVPLLPILGLALTFGIREALARGRAVRVALLLAVSGLVAGYAAFYPALQYRHAHPLRAGFRGLDWTRYLPGWLSPDDRTVPLTGLALLVVLGLVGLGRARSDSAIAPPARLVAAGALTLAAVAGVILAGDRLAGVREPHLTQDDANHRLRTLLLRLEAVRPRDRALAVRTGAPLAPDPLRLVYEAERLPGHAPRTVEDPLAGNGLARTGDRAGAHAVFGPYETLPGGSYRALFRIRGEPDRDAGRAGTLGITAARGRVEVAIRTLRSEELSPSEYRDIGVDFVLPGRTADLEWRVRLEQPGGLRIDRITVLPLGWLAGLQQDLGGASMLKAVTLKEIQEIFAVTDAMGISREALVIPLAPGRPGHVRRLSSGKLEIVVDAELPLAEWLRELPARIQAAQS